MIMIVGLRVPRSRPLTPGFRKPFRAAPVELGSYYLAKERRRKHKRLIGSIGLATGTFTTILALGMAITHPAMVKSLWNWGGQEAAGVSRGVFSIAALGKGQSPARTFVLCHTGGGTNCVVDGDTIWMDGVKIRVADIDAPETHPPRCDVEAALGERATNRLLALVNEGPFDAQPIGNRDTDRYGRKLRVLVRNGQSLGDILVREGLARTWDGARHPWC